jgi:hypothetical protein
LRVCRRWSVVWSVGIAGVFDGAIFDRLGFSDGLALADGVELIAEFAACEEAVHFARAVDLAFDADAGGQVFEKDAVGGLVDFLSARARAAHEFFQQVFFANPEGGHALFERGGFFR